MKKIFALVFGLLAASQAFAADNMFPTPGNSQAQGAVNMCLNASNQAVPCSNSAPLSVSSSPVPAGATPITVSTAGTTAATAASLPGVANKTTYICGVSITSNATAATSGTALVGGMSFLQGVAALPAVATLSQNFTPCVSAGSTGISIAILSTAAGAGGVTNVNAWGYQL